MLTIGQFSKTCLVTVKTLRHYDKVGLIHPCVVNEENGYRFYSEEQIPRMLLIKKLKYYGFSLSDIKDMLSDRESILPKLQKQRNALLQSLDDMNMIINDLARHIRELERTGDIMSYQNNYEIELQETKAIPVISTRQHMSVDDYGKYYGTLYKRVADENIVLSGECLAIYHDKEFNPENSDIELALGVLDAKQADKTMEGSLCVSTVHFGSYATLPEAYGAITAYINEKGYTIAAPPYEIYVTSHFDRIPVEEWETRIFFPVERQG